MGRAQRCVEQRAQGRVAPAPAGDVAGQPAEPGAQEPELVIGALEVLGMDIAPCHQRRPLGDPDIGLARLEPLALGHRAELLDRLEHQLGIGRMSDVLRLDGGVDGDPGKIVHLQRAGVVRHPQALLDQEIKLVADPAAPVGQPRALVGKACWKNSSPVKYWK